MFWFVQLATRICRGSQTLSCSHPHKHSAHFFSSGCDWSKDFFGEIKHDISLCIKLSFIRYNIKKTHVIIHACYSPLEIAHLACFKVLRINSNLTSKPVHGNSSSNVELRNALGTTLFVRRGKGKQGKARVG